MEIIESFNNLINGIEPVTLILLVSGIILIISAFSRSSYFTFGFSGFLAFAAALAVRYTASRDMAQVFILFFLILLTVTVSFIASVRFSKYGWIIRMPLAGSENKDNTGALKS